MPAGALSPVPEQPSPTGGYTLGDLYDKYEARSTRASENVRYLAGAGIAVVWMLSRQSIEGLTRGLLCTLALCVGALLFDFLHYVVAAHRLGQLHQKYVGEGKVRQNFVTIPKRTNRPGTILYWIKIGALVFAFGSLMINFAGRLGAAPADPAVPKPPAPARSADAASEPPALMCGGDVGATALRGTISP